MELDTHLWEQAFGSVFCICQIPETVPEMYKGFKSSPFLSIDIKKSVQLHVRCSYSKR